LTKQELVNKLNEFDDNAKILIWIKSAEEFTDITDTNDILTWPSDTDNNMVVEIKVNY
jgi:hypothetical protein